MSSTLSWVVEYMNLADSDCVLWLGLTEDGEGGVEGKILTFKSVKLFYISGDSKKKKKHKKVVVWLQLGTWDEATLWWAPNYHFFYVAP